MPRVVTEPLGGSPLSLAIQRGDVPGTWVQRAPRTPDDWRRAALATSGDFASGSGGWLNAVAPALSARGAAASMLDRVADAGGVVVTTGQQPGLFGGALLTLVKALSARALATELEERTGVPTGTIFWAATDDADFKEASVVYAAFPGGARELRWTGAPPEGTPMAAAPLGDLEPARRLLGEACGSAASGDVLRMVDAAYQTRATAGDAYVQLLRALLEPMGIAVIDASHPSVRRAGEGLLRRALSEADRIASASAERSAEILAAGYAPQVEEVAGLSLVFDASGGTKRRVPLAEAGAAATSAKADGLSATVLLRPVLERSILPTVAYVAGPAELAYFAQVSAVADALGARRPTAVPRWSMTIVEERVERILERLGVDRAAVRDADHLAATLARARLPGDARATLVELRGAIEAAHDGLAASGVGPLMGAAAIDGLRAQLLHRLDRGERRAAAAVRRHDAALQRDVGTAHGALYPGGVRQERMLSYIPYLARYGDGLLDNMLEEATTHARTHIQELTSVVPAGGT